MNLRLTTLVCLLLTPALVHAEFAQVQLAKVPVARLLANLERRSKADPNDASVHASLARVHAMAYALAADALDVRKGYDEPWAGYMPALVPTSKPVGGGKREHLDAAVAEYKRALELLGKQVPTPPLDTFASPNEIWRLNLAWCIDQSGDKDKARAMYRALFAAGWSREKKQTTAGLAEHFVAEEAAGYLIPLLDPKKDAAEISRLDAARKQLNALPRPITPILVGASADATLEQSVDAQANVLFDLDGTGAHRWGWIRPGAAWLVYAPTGCVTSGLQMFGSVTFWVFFHDGYQALAALDDDGDGFLRGSELAALRLWRDNGDGICTEGELERLDGIREIATRPSAPWSHARGLVYADGRTRPTYDWVTTSR